MKRVDSLNGHAPGERGGWTGPCPWAHRWAPWGAPAKPPTALPHTRLGRPEYRSPTYTPVVTTWATAITRRSDPHGCLPPRENNADTSTQHPLGKVKLDSLPSSAWEQGGRRSPALQPSTPSDEHREGAPAPGLGALHGAQAATDSGHFQPGVATWEQGQHRPRHGGGRQGLVPEAPSSSEPQPRYSPARATGGQGSRQGGPELLSLGDLPEPHLLRDGSRCPRTRGESTT